ncbi:anthranilate synthase component 1 [Providencia rettgeri]|uniref:Anthranilate synthase component 1 n=2 Tax=Providencia TaxID=586 RepID=A0AA42FKA5_9GAMM|nr:MULTISPECIES: anthranilate synthase component 1 [Providencia]MBC8653529.1 anthranilate synthase component 1 [Providencia vermicola]EIL1984277.1 anthranilate synthase component 1 [Providencia rettgeri]EIU9516403.1 anthranilate synthase component 1 [Providencia rettgeri]EJD6370603.1 anthranilate synthase component 1 [Providencia rettgeri]EJD6374524.1 anthranilate synthase component 1 [Providencia rettgeri]
MNKQNTTLAHFKYLDSPINYQPDPTLLFNHLCQQVPSTMLLESAEVNNKANLQSLLIVNSALRIRAFAQRVEIEALTPNGQSLLPKLLTELNGRIAHHDLSDNLLTVSFNQPKQDLDEDNRLKAPSSLDVLRALPTIAQTYSTKPETLFVGGLFAYDLVAGFEDLPEVKSVNQCPDYCFFVAEHYLVIDHQNQAARIKSCIFSDNQQNIETVKQRHEQIIVSCRPFLPELPLESAPNFTVTVNKSDQEYGAIVTSLKEAIYRGDIFQVVPSRKFTMPCAHPLISYQKLKLQNPSPYMFYMQDQDFTLFGASPESALKYATQTRKVEIYPIAGTRPRGRNAQGDLDLDLDSRIELSMRSDEKELAEHIMLVDLARNDLARICEAGSRYVANLTKVDRYSFVMHLVSHVVGTLRQDLDIFHAYQACMNMGTLTGAPKVKAMQLIAQNEQERRGSYGGAVGYFQGNGDFDTCIVIRSAYVENGIATVQAGGGVVLDSSPQAEADETRNKARAVIRAIAQAHQVKELF